MDLRVHLGAFNTLVRDMFNSGEKIEKENQACLFMTFLPKSYDLITISLLEKKSDLTMSEVTAVLLDSESLRQCEEDVSGSSSVLVTASDWRRRKRSGRGTCHKCGKPDHFRRDCPERRLNRPPTPRASRTAVAIGDDYDVIVCVGEEDVYESVSGGTGSGSGGAGSSWVLDSGSTFHVCPRRDWFDSFREVSGETMTLADGSTFSVVRVGAIRFRMWDDMIRTVTDVRYVPGVRRSLMSLSELDSHGYELWIHDGSMEVLRGDLVVIQGTRRSGFYEMIGMVKYTFTIVSADTPTWRVVGGDDMTGCSGVVTVETCHMAVSAIAQLPGQRIVGGGRLGRMEFRGHLGTDGGRCGYAMSDVAWGIGSVRSRAVDSGLM
jgi:gag-polypeptide of LTR copia-type/Zinc knuckle